MRCSAVSPGAQAASTARQVAVVAESASVKLIDRNTTLVSGTVGVPMMVSAPLPLAEVLAMVERCVSSRTQRLGAQAM